MATVAIFGAAGSMGTRAWRALKERPGYELLLVEAGDAGPAKLRERGLEPADSREAAARADVVLLAVPDALLAGIAANVVPHMRSGAMAMCLDPAAPYAGILPRRGDVSYFVTHPTHPPLFCDETDPHARRDFFGSGLAKQSIVSALMQGSEDDYARGEAIARDLFGPILRSHRVTVEQMALLEPALSETVAATCVTVIREAMDEAVRRGVPPEAARDFLLGHVRIELAIVFGELDWQFSVGAKRAIEEARGVLFRPDWRRVFEPEELRASVERIAGVRREPAP